MPAEAHTESEKLKSAIISMRRSTKFPPMRTMQLSQSLWNDMVQDPRIEIPVGVVVTVAPTLGLDAAPGVMPPDFVN